MIEERASGAPGVTGAGAGDVLLRDVTERDLPLLFEHQRDPDANRMAGFPPRDREAFTEHWRGILDDPSKVAKAVVFRGTVTGNVVSWEQDGRREIGYWIGRDHWGRGIASEAVAQLLRLVAERPLYACVAVHNAASIRVLEKCGFVRAVEGAGEGELLLVLPQAGADSRAPTASEGDR